MKLNVSYQHKHSPIISCLHIYLVNGPILNHTESKLIFGNIPELLKIHENLLKDIEIIIDELTIGKNRSLGNNFVLTTLIFVKLVQGNVS